MIRNMTTGVAKSSTKARNVWGAVLALGLLLGGCAVEQAPPAAQPVPVETPAVIVPTVTEGDLAGKRFVATAAPVDGLDGDPLNISFLAGDDGSYLINPWAGCNSMSGEFSITKSGGVSHLQVGNLIQTMMACMNESSNPDIPDPEAWWAEFLSSNPEITLDGDELTLTSGEESVVLVNDGAVDASGDSSPSVEFASTTVNGLPATVPLPNPITLTFANDIITANVGCNQIFGSYTIDPDDATDPYTGALQVESLAATRMYCDGVMDTEVWITDFLKSHPHISRSGNSLELSDGEVDIKLLAVDSGAQ
jgi:heat shock protein HslJ